MKPIHVLIAEDDTRIAEIQSQLLNGIDGFQVVGMAHSLATTREMTELLAPDLLLLDIQFPDGNGLDYVDQMRTSKIQTDVILITAAREVEMLKTAIFGGVFDYIVKPLVFDRIKDSLERYRKRHIKLGELNTLDQNTIDTILPPVAITDSQSQRTAMGKPTKIFPKGIDSLTLNKVRDFLDQTQGSIAASEVGTNIGVCRTTARRYLEYLVSTQELQVDLSYGAPGRPERHYSSTNP